MEVLITNFYTEFIEALAQRINITEIFRCQIEEAMYLLLETERTAFLGFEHYDNSGYNSGNSRNVYYTRRLISKYGVLNLKIPRDRNGLFSQKTIRSFNESKEAKLSLEDFFGKYSSKYPKVKESLENKENLFTYLEFPKSIRPSIYTNNISETFNKQLKRKAKVKEQFPHETSLEKYVYTYVSKYNTKFFPESIKVFLWHNMN